MIPRGKGSFLKHVPDYFVTEQHYNYGMMTMIISMMINVLNGTMVIKKEKAQKAQIKEELMPIAWHSSRYWDWHMSEDEKRETEKLWV